MKTRKFIQTVSAVFVMSLTTAFGQLSYNFTTIAGTAGVYGNADGTNGAAQFGGIPPPLLGLAPGIVVDSGGNLYVADTGNDTIRKLTPVGTNWVVTTIAGLAGNYGSADGTNGDARFLNPSGITVDSGGNLFVADRYNDTIRKVAPVGTNWVVTTIAGLAGNYGSADGIGTNALFSWPGGVAVDNAGNIYVADSRNATIRMVTPVGTNWVVTTIAGLAGNYGSADGIGTNALFSWPGGVAVDNAGNIYVADSRNTTIRQGTSQIQPVINLQPTNSIVLAGSNVVLSVSAFGLPTLTYQWQNSQGAITNATNANFTISNAQLTNADNYSVIVSNPYGSVTSVVATVTVVFPPSISLQPIPQVVAAGTNLSLAVLADGTTPLIYQWQNSAGAIAGQTNSNLILNPALTNYTDNYSVVVSNPYGAITSQVVTVFVYLPVSIQAQPASLVVPASATASFGVTASGFPAPISYQWTHNGTNLTGAISNTFTIKNVHLADLGSYQVLVSNGYSSTTSDIATLNMSPSITSPFGGAITIWGRSAVLSVGAIGSGGLNYQWYKDGVAIDGATSATLNFTSIQFTNGGLYSVVVSSPFGVITNVAAQVVINPAGVSLGFCPALTITGAVGYSYIIQSSCNLTDTNAWNTLTNLTLTQPVQIWVDTSVDASSPFNSMYFYRVLPGQ
jgi:hypothetical protein